MGADYYTVETGVFTGNVMKYDRDDKNLWSTILSNKDNYDIYLSIYEEIDKRICWLILADKESLRIDLKTDVVGPYIIHDGSFIYETEQDRIRFLSASVLGIMKHTDFSVTEADFLEYYGLD